MSNNNSTFSIPRYVRTHFHHLALTDKWLYCCLFDLCEQANGTCSYSLRQLKKETGISVAALHRSVHQLQGFGLIQAIKKARSTGGSEVYHISLIPLTPQQAIAMSLSYEETPKELPNSELIKLTMQLSRAEDAGLNATLSLGDWLVTLDCFENKCAYCGGPYEVIEHFVPVTLGGGTTKANCVPACGSCNTRKKDYHPLLMPASTGMAEAIRNVQNYLSLCGNEDL